jgi:hypothetical protein
MISGYPVMQHKEIEPPVRNEYQATTIELGFDAVIEQISPLPAYSLLIGVCEDGTPLILDLQSPSSGPILLVSDNRFGNRQLLRSMLLSACRLNTGQDVNIHLVTPNVRAYPKLVRQPHFIQAFDRRDMASWILVEEFVRLGRERQMGMEAYPMQIFAIDEIDLLLQDFEKELLQQFQWLLEVGPEVNIWVAATLSANHVHRRWQPLLKSFRTQIFGRIESPDISTQLAGKPFLDLADNIPGVDCTVRSDGEDISVLIPQLENAVNPLAKK